MPLFNIQVGLAGVSLECSESMFTMIGSSVFSAIIKPASAQAKIHYRLQTQNDRTYLFRNQHLTHRNRQLSRIIYALEWQIVNDLIQQNSSTFKLHAAALALNDSGLIFCGAPSTGKTSLSILLMQNGWQFLSDEFALLSTDGQVIPFPRNLIIKPHLRHKVVIPTDLTVFRVDGDQGEKKDAYYLSPQIFGTVLPISSVPIGSFIFLENNDQTGFDLQPIAHSEAFRLLMQHLFNPRILKQKGLDFLLDLLNICPVYRLKISSPLDLASADRQALIKQLIGIGFND